MLNKTSQEMPEDYPVPLPPNPMTNVNPLTTGLQVGALGAAAGMGWAAIHRALRMNSGNAIPVDVVKPMIIGALIGSTLGVAVGRMPKKNQISPRPQTWQGVEQSIMDQASAVPQPSGYKYAGLQFIVEKRAQSAIGTAADIGSYFIPGVGTVRSGYDTLSSAGGMAKALFKGNWREAGGKALSTLGNAGMLIGSLIPGGNLLTGAAKALRAGRALKGVRASGGLISRLGAMAGPKVGPGAVDTMERYGNKLKGIMPKGRANLIQTTSMVPAFAGSMLEATGPEMNPAIPATAARAARNWNIRPTAMPSIEDAFYRK